MNEKKISILGCGWLGKTLAAHLIKNGASVKVSTSSKTNYDTLKKTFGKQVYQLGIFHDRIEGNVDDFLESDLLVINITPHRAEKEKEQFAAFLPLLEASSIKKVLFVSATSVYPMLNRVLSEDQGLENTAHPLYKSEQLFLSNPSFETTVVRMAGLIGGTRHPGRFFAKSGRIKNSEAPVNLIHRRDCIQIITAIIQQDAWGEVFNACASSHPSKAAFYSKAAQSIGLEPPICEAASESAFKEISNKKIKEVLGIQLEYDNLMDLLNEGNWI